MRSITCFTVLGVVAMGAYASVLSDDAAVIPYEEYNVIATIGDKNLSRVGLPDEEGVYLAFGDEILIDDPVFEIDSLSPTTYRFDMLGRIVTVDFNDQSSVEGARAACLPLSGYVRFDGTASDSKPGVRSSYRLTVDKSPDDNVNLWMQQRMLDALAEIYSRDEFKKTLSAVQDWHALAKEVSWGLLDGVDLEPEALPEDFSLLFSAHTDARVRYSNEQVVTFRLYTNVYMAGGHGMYYEQLMSYDPRVHCTIDNDYLFEPGAQPHVWNLIYQGLASDPDWRYWNQLDDYTDLAEVGSRVGRWVSDYGDGEKLPPSGIVEDGVIFTFQPYEIGPFAAGAYHVFVSSQDLAPYMTPKAKALFAN